MMTNETTTEGSVSNFNEQPSTEEKRRILGTFTKRFFGVESLEDVTPEMLEEARQSLDVQLPGNVQESEYQVEVCYGELGSGENYPLGTWKGMAANHDDAEQKALDELWDSRLDSASCSPRVRVICTVYKATVEDVENVLRSNSLATANTKGKSFESMANELHSDLDFDLIEQAALAGEDLDEQADYASDEIARQLREMGILQGNDRHLCSEARPTC